MAMSPFTARDWVAWHAETGPDAPALRSGDDGRLTTWGELEERVAGLAGYLQSGLGVAAGDRVAVLAHGDPRVFEIQFACMRLGAIMVPLNWRLADRELAEIIALCEPSTLIWDAPMASRAIELSAGISKPGFGWDCAGDWPRYEACIRQADPVRARSHASLDEVTQILYTSGTTGRPKGALTTQGGMAAQALNSAHTSKVAEPGCHHLNPMPLFHAGGLHSLANPILYFGGQVTVLARFVPGQTLRVMSEHRATHFNSIPAMYAEMAALPAFDELDLSAMRLCVVAGAVATPELLERWHAKGIAMQPQYGATETGPTVTALMPARDLAAARSGTAGQRAPNVEIRLVNSGGEDVDSGAEGEIWVRGPAITPGYWRAERSDYFTGDWLRTGDVARRDDRGYYYVVGRSKEMYKSGGENVYPAEVERVLSGAPGIDDIAIIGVQDPKWGESGVAVVVCAQGSSPDLETLRAFGQRWLAKYKLPQRLVVVPELPRNVTGKVNRARLAELYAAPPAQGQGETP